MQRARHTPENETDSPLLAGEWPDPVEATRGEAPAPPYVSEVAQLDASSGLRLDAPEDGTQWGPGDTSSPPLTSSFLPGVEGVDAMIAVGHKFVVVTQDHRIAYFDRAGNALPSKSGEATNLTTTKFFERFLKPFNDDGTANANCINRHLHFPADAVKVCDLTTYPPQLPCVDEFYDTRCTYDAGSRRFFICAAARNQIWPGKPGGAYDALGRRYFAFAVSKGEDPRDGFFQWFWNDDKQIADWPRIAVNGDNFVVAHQTEQAGKPLAYVFSVSAMLQGVSSLPHWTYGAADVGDDEGTLVPVTHQGDPAGLTYLVRARANFEIFAFTGSPAGGAARPALQSTSVGLASAPSTLRAGAVYRAGKIHCTCMILASPRVPDEGGPRMSVRVVRIPVKRTSFATIQASVDPALGFLDMGFGKRSPDDAPDDLISYEMPALAVAKTGAMIFVFGRVGVATQQSLFPEARYSAHYPDEAKQRPSRLLRAGDFLPTSVHKGETKATATHYIDHPGGIDYGTAVVDPVDDETVWMIHEFANQARGGYKAVVGVTKP
jgi:hypothetical protein